MDLVALKTLASVKGGRSLLQLKKHSPEILTAVGIASGVTAAVMGAKATLKLENTLDHGRERIEHTRQAALAVRPNGELEIPEHQLKKDLAYVYTRNVLDIGKLYGPAISLGTVSIVCIIGAQGIMQKRNAALVGAYVALEKGFAEYRQRVEDRIGSDEERDIRLGITREQVTNKKGETHEIVKVDPNGVSGYARFFDELNRNWKRDAEYNRLFILGQQQWANNLLDNRGHVFLNEVYDMLGMERSREGALVGWVRGHGDGFVDFGMYRGGEMVREFVNGHERSILLDFNVDGMIFDLI